MTVEEVGGPLGDAWMSKVRGVAFGCNGTGALKSNRRRPVLQIVRVVEIPRDQKPW
jgi:hypothetical protein